MITYKYLQDTRDKDTYKKYIEAGVKNQRIAIKQFRQDIASQGIKTRIKWTDTNDKFAKDLSGISAYKPDVKILFKWKGDFVREYEVKVSDKNPGEKLHFKKYQIDYLNEHHPGSRIFYSTKERYFIVPVSEIAKFPTVFSDKIGGKECYSVYTPGLVDLWRVYSEPLELESYPND